MEFLFWSFFIAIIYVYVGYPVVVAFLSFLLGRRVNKGEIFPYVTIITAAYNEEDVVEQTVRNKYGLDYPKDRYQYLVVSDASTDNTDAIVERLGAELSEKGFNMRLIRQPERRGKTAALNAAVEKLKNSDAYSDGLHIVVFADANSIYEKDALKRLVFNFNDDEVGYVTGRMLYFTNKGGAVSEGCSMYMRYENLLREFETNVGSVVGVDGGIDAVRLDLYVEMDESDLPDFVLPLTVIERGYRVVYEPSAILKEEALDCAENEFRMRVRVALRSYDALLKKIVLLNPFKYGIYSFQLFSHKILRYSAGLFQVLLFILNILLIYSGPLYKPFLAIQEIFYFFAFLGYYYDKEGKEKNYFYVPYYLCLLNFASLVAVFEFIMGKKIVVWEPRKGE